jgi:hypothetical protein
MIHDLPYEICPDQGLTPVKSDAGGRILRKKGVKVGEIIRQFERKIQIKSAIVIHREKCIGYISTAITAAEIALIGQDNMKKHGKIRFTLTSFIVLPGAGIVQP